MKILQEYIDESDNLASSMDLHIRRIEKLPLPYTGNKKKLVYQIAAAINKHHLQFDTILDAFTGSATVAYLFKLMGKKVIANDLLTSSYLNAVAFVENEHTILSDEEKDFLLHHQNTNKGTFVEDNYLGIEFRPPGKTCRFNKFTLKECQHLDNFRANIDELCGIAGQSIGLAANTAIVMRLPFGQVDQTTDILHHRKKQAANYGKKGSENHDRRIGIYYDEELNLKFDKWFHKYVSDFTEGIKPDICEQKIKRASFLVNLQQHVLRDCMVQGRMHNGQSLAEIGVRLAHPKNQLKGHWSNQGSTEMDFFTQSGTDWKQGQPGQGLKWWTFADDALPGSAVATNMDVTELLKSGIKVDAVYWDPPYSGSGGASDYAVIYRFLEEYIYSQPLEDLPHIQHYAHKFVKKKNYETYFLEMLESSKNIPIWLFSYNDNSWKSIEYITDLIKLFRKEVVVEVLSDNYRYLYSHRQGREKRATEYLIIAR